ncbi:hypothetical protein EDD21DRAFT_119038 [Dissophora ornata]|nr:hypothetical protein EDD21DRAFT_119038 [Dissophora ornata]
MQKELVEQRKKKRFSYFQRSNTVAFLLLLCFGSAPLHLSIKGVLIDTVIIIFPDLSAGDGSIRAKDKEREYVSYSCTLQFHGGHAIVFFFPFSPRLLVCHMNSKGEMVSSGEAESRKPTVTNILGHKKNNYFFWRVFIARGGRFAVSYCGDCLLSPDSLPYTRVWTAPFFCFVLFFVFFRVEVSVTICKQL